MQPGVRLRFLGQFNAYARTTLATHGMEIGDMDHQWSTIDSVQGLLVDSYALSQTELDQFADQPFPLILIDDFMQWSVQRAGLVISFLCGAERRNYNARGLALGTRYFPAKPEFMPIRERNLTRERSTPRRLLVCLGGSDHHGVLPQLLQVLDGHFEDVDMTCLTNAPPVFRAKRNHLAFRPISNNIEAELAAADMVISGGGLLKYESAFCAIPNACLHQTDAQATESRQVIAQQLCVDLGLAEQPNTTMIQAGLTQLVDPDWNQAFISASNLAFDGDSLTRLSRAILKVCSTGESRRT